MASFQVSCFDQLIRKRNCMLVHHSLHLGMSRLKSCALTSEISEAARDSLPCRGRFVSVRGHQEHSDDIGIVSPFGVLNDANTRSESCSAALWKRHMGARRR